MESQLPVKELARNFADYINRVVYRGERFVIVRSNRPVAELWPLPVGRRLGELPALLSSVPHLDPDEAAAFEADLDAARAEVAALPIRDPWPS